MADEEQKVQKEETLRDKTLKLLREMFASDLSTWEYVTSKSDSAGNQLKAYRILNTPGKPGTFIKIRNVFHFPTISPEDLFEMVSNTKERMRWDKRMVDPRLIYWD